MYYAIHTYAKKNAYIHEKWMEETTNPMIFMQQSINVFSEAAGVPHTLRSSHACLILMPPRKKKMHTLCSRCTYMNERRVVLSQYMYNVIYIMHTCTCT